MVVPVANPQPISTAAIDKPTGAETNNKPPPITTLAPVPPT